MITRKIIAFGDSFTTGTDLADCSANSPKLQDPSGFYLGTSQHTWPALMAKDFNLKYGCYAVGGQGNMLISNSVIEIYERSHFKNRNFYVINWTWFDRFDYFDTASDAWHTIHPRHDNLESHFFYKHIDSEVWNIIRNMHVIISTINFLQSRKIGFFMTCLDDLLFSKDYPENFTPLINALQQQVQPYIHRLDQKNFYQWAQDKKFAMGATGHPLEEAHKEAASLWYQDFKIELLKNDFF
jgi:hypothetical protein